MPEKQTLARVRADRRKGKAPSTQAGEFIKEEMDHIRNGIHGAQSTKQAIAIGLSKARRAGIRLPPPKKGKASAVVRRRASRDLASAHRPRTVSARRARASLRALKKEGTEAAAPRSLARHARAASTERSAAERSASAERAARTKGPAERSAAAAKAARTRTGHSGRRPRAPERVFP
jgi:hypothetical protein